MPGVVYNGVGSCLIASTKMIVGVDGFDVECDDFSATMRKGEGESGIGAKDIPKDVAEENEDGGENVKAEKKKENAKHSLILVIDPFLWSQVFSIVPF